MSQILPMAQFAVRTSTPSTGSASTGSPTYKRLSLKLIISCADRSANASTPQISFTYSPTDIACELLVESHSS